MTTLEVRAELEPDGTLRPIRVEPGQDVRVVVVPARIARTRSASMLFATDSPVLAPTSRQLTPFAPLAGAVRELRARGGRLVVLGHASPTGNDTHNEALAAARAQTVAAWLTRDETRWVDTVAEHGSPADTHRWLAHWARTLGWDTDPGRVDDTIDAATKRAVAAFQREYSNRFAQDLELDGRITASTLSALFSVSVREFEAHLREADVEPAAVDIAEHDIIGCGTSFADDPDLVARFGSLPEQQQRVDVVVVPPDCKWMHEHGPEALMLFTRQDASAEFGPAPLADRLEIRLKDRYGRPVSSAAYTLFAGDEQRSGTTDDDGRLVEDDVDADRLRLVLDSGELVVFDHPYALAAAPAQLDVAAVVEDAEELEALPDEPLPALFDDADEESEVIDFSDDDEDDGVEEDDA